MARCSAVAIDRIGSGGGGRSVRTVHRRPGRPVALPAVNVWVVLLLLCGAVPGGLAASALAQAPVRVLLGQQVVDAASHEVVAVLGLTDHGPCAELIGGCTFAVGDALVDPDAGHVLFVALDRVRLVGLDKQPLWSSARADVHVAARAGDGPRWFAKDRIVLAREGGGLVALDRRSGRVAWEGPGLPTASVLVDGDLVVATGDVGGKPHLVGAALANGARAFDVELAGAAQRIVAAPHGIAVVERDGFVVHDRAGPRLFAVTTPVTALTAGPDAWFGATGDAVVAWARNGERRWGADVAHAGYERVVLVATPDGGVLRVKWMDIADSGFDLVSLAVDGGIRWRREEPGLGVPHSKYWHRVQPRLAGDRLLVTSQAAGGSFLAEFDLATGERVERTGFGSK